MKVCRYAVCWMVLTAMVVITGSPARATTYYVRPDGGTAEQCTGTSDAPYPGSGTNQPCAWSHPFWALDANGEWRIKGGDTLVIGAGSYKMGYGAPNTEWCYREGAYDCHLPPLPSGTSQQPTRIVGAGWDLGCSSPPELWGTERAFYIISLENTSHAEVQCLELTDHSGCVYAHSNPSVRCERDSYPFGDYADAAIYAYNSHDVTLKNLNIHGFASDGLLAGKLSDWTLENVRIAGNGWSGWNGDTYHEDDSMSGTIRLRRVTVEWNGCAETYPQKSPDHCWAQSAGGYGDGVGMPRSGGHWIIEDSTFQYNTSDGLDLLYVGVGYPDSKVEIRRTKARGNAGNQLKVGGDSVIVNSLVVGNCGFFYEKSFAQEMGGRDSGDHCRAGGGAVAVSLGEGDSSYIINDTIASQGWALIEAQCSNRDFPDQAPCQGEASVTIKNNILIGYQDFNVDYFNQSDLVGDNDPDHLAQNHIDYNVVYGPEVYSLLGAHDLIKNPRIVSQSLDSFDGHLQEESPAIDSGLAVGSIGGLVPADDITGATRPYGEGVDRGAYEYGAVPENRLPSPTGQHFYSYPAVAEPSCQQSDPALCRPFAVGDVAGGTLNLKVGLLAFTEAVDVYLALYAEPLGEEIYLWKADKSLQPFSAGMVAWREGLSTAVSESLYGDIPTDLLPSGTYFLFTLVCPEGEISSGAFDAYYLWQTDFTITGD